MAINIGNILNVKETTDQNIVCVLVELDIDDNGEFEELEYVLVEGDEHGIAPQIREAAKLWLEGEGNSLQEPDPIDYEATKSSFKQIIYDVSEQYRTLFISNQQGKQASQQLKAEVSREVVNAGPNAEVQDRWQRVLGPQAEKRSISIYDYATSINDIAEAAEAASGIIGVEEETAEDEIDNAVEDENIVETLKSIVEAYSNRLNQLLSTNVE